MDRLAYWKRRAQHAEAQLEFEKRENAITTMWARDAFVEQRRLGDRCTFLAALAIANGATLEDLRGLPGESVPA